MVSLVLMLSFSLFSSGHLSGDQKASQSWGRGGGWDVRGRFPRPPRAPAEVVLALREAARGCGCQVRHAGPFLLCCSHGSAGSKVAFQAEVCQLSVGPAEANGVRYTRLWGAPLAFRHIASQISKEVELWGDGGGELTRRCPLTISVVIEIWPMCYRLNLIPPTTLNTHLNSHTCKQTQSP